MHCRCTRHELLREAKGTFEGGADGKSTPASCEAAKALEGGSGRSDLPTWEYKEDLRWDYHALDLDSVELRACPDAGFANSATHSSQLGDIPISGTTTTESSVFYWFSNNARRVTRSTIADEWFALLHEVNIVFALQNLILENSGGTVSFQNFQEVSNPSERQLSPITAFRASSPLHQQTSNSKKIEPRGKF
jgi:hypothetical protein